MAAQDARTRNADIFALQLARADEEEVIRRKGEQMFVLRTAAVLHRDRQCATARLGLWRIVWLVCVNARAHDDRPARHAVCPRVLRRVEENELYERLVRRHARHRRRVHANQRVLVEAEVGEELWHAEDRAGRHVPPAQQARLKQYRVAHVVARDGVGTHPREHV